MKFRHYDNLRVFTIVAMHGSFASAAEALNLTKGAISHQIRQLEGELGFSLFERLPRGISLTPHGRELLSTAGKAFTQLEQTIEVLQGNRSRVLTVAVTSYFASRWLSPRLMDFMQQHPAIRLRLQPMVTLTNLSKEGIDLAIRWGNGHWNDVATELLFRCAAWPAGNAMMRDRVDEVGFEQAVAGATLLHDGEGSNAWSEWFTAAGVEFVPRADTLIIPDPNVRVQAVIDGQGIAINDALIERELADGSLYRLSEAELPDYGYYLALTENAILNPDAEVFGLWLKGLA